MTTKSDNLDPESIARTQALLNRIDAILTDADVPSFQAPEEVLPHKFRIARFFIEQFHRDAIEGDKGIAAWLRWLAAAEPPEIAAVLNGLSMMIERRDHWRWIQNTPQATWPTKPIGDLDS
jgi:hypothetical protein